MFDDISSMPGNTDEERAIWLYSNQVFKMMCGVVEEFVPAERLPAFWDVALQRLDALVKPAVQ